MGMTQEQLTAHIKGVVAPLIKETVGTEVAELVRESVNNALKASKGENYAAKMFEDGKKNPTPGSRMVGGKMEPGIAMARGLRAVAASKLLGGGSEKAIEILKAWGETELAESWQSNNSKALLAGDPFQGGFLVPTQFSSDVIELLRPSAVVRSLDPTIMQMPMGSVKVPKITQGAAATYVGESVAPNATGEQTGQLTLTFKKLIAIVPISNDLVRYSSPSADTIVRDDMVRALATREDKAFLRDDGTSGTPKGIKNWVNAGNKFAANAVVNLANVTTDLGKAIQRLMAADVPIIVQQFPAGGPNQVQPVTSRPGWIFSPRTYMYLTTVQNGQGFYAFRSEMMTGTLWGFPYRVTSQMPETEAANGNETGTGTMSEVIFGAFAHAVIGEALSMSVDASTDAAYLNAAGVTTAAFSADQTVVRVLAEHDFALRYDKAFSLIQSVTWGL